LATYLRALLQISAPPLLPLLAATLCLLGETAAALTAPWIGGRFGAQLLEKAEPADYRTLLLIWLILMLLQYALRFASSYLMGSAGAMATAGLRNRIYDHLQAMPLHYHESRDRGETLTLLSRDAGIVGQFLTSTLPSLPPQLLMLLGAWAMMMQLNLGLGILIGLAVPLVVFSVQALWRRTRPVARRLADAHADHLALAEENLRLLPILKAFGREPLESRRAADHSSTIQRLERDHLLLTSGIAPLVQSFGTLLLVLVLWLGARQISTGELDTAAAISLLLYGLLLFRPAGQLAGSAGNLFSTLGAASRINEALDQPAELHRKGSQQLPDQAGAIVFDHLVFAYPGQARLFDGFDLQIQPGEVVAITGSNGSGKSTLTRLLMRFVTPVSGQIRLGGQDIQELQLATLRQAIGLVPQDVVLLNGSIRDNIAYALPEADDVAILAAASQAQLQPLIAALPNGLDTQIGPDGILLSGGQRQRIALARALLRHCPILILDEATAMFDNESEASFIETARRSLTDRTVILITHRPASLSLANRVIRLSGPARETPAGSANPQHDGHAESNGH